MQQAALPPRFSILTPAYNAERTLARAIDSVLAQTCGDFEHIIVDDGSTDGTLALAHSYAERDSRIRVVANPHQSLPPTRIAAMTAATGELFVRLDADDRLGREYLERVGSFFDEYPDAQIVSTNGYQVHADGREVYYYTDPYFGQVSSLGIGDMLSGRLFGTSAVMTRGVFQMTGGPRPEAKSEDIDLWMRAIAMGAVHYHLPEAVFYYHQDAPNRDSADTRAVWRSHIEIIENLMREGLLSEADTALARRAIRRYRFKLAIRWDAWGVPLRRRLAEARHP